MSWKCRIVEQVGYTYRVIWLAGNENGHTHRAERSITKDEYESVEKYTKFDNVPAQCARCGEVFQCPPVFGSKLVWNTADGNLHIGDMYHSDHAGFSDWWVVLPGGTRFNIHRKSSTDGKPWDVSGEAPNITLRTSVVIPHEWHGWITNGVISDDLEGRTYD